MIRLPVLKDELAFLERLLPDLETRPDLGHLAIEIKKQVQKIRREILALERDQKDRDKERDQERDKERRQNSK